MSRLVSPGSEAFVSSILKIASPRLTHTSVLLGSPGNGKTESIKALLKEAPYPALYVKSFTTQRVRLYTLTDRTTMLTLASRGLKLESEVSSLTHARKPLASWSLRFVTFLLCATRSLKRPRISMLWSRQTCAASS